MNIIRILKILFLTVISITPFCIVTYLYLKNINNIKIQTLNSITPQPTVQPTVQGSINKPLNRGRIGGIRGRVIRSSRSSGFDNYDILFILSILWAILSGLIGAKLLGLMSQKI